MTKPRPVVLSSKKKNTAMEQLDLFRFCKYTNEIKELIKTELNNHHQPSALELVNLVETKINLEARWDLKSAITELINDSNLTKTNIEYLESIIQNDYLDNALKGVGVTDTKKIKSTIDHLFKQSKKYRKSKSFHELIEFMGKFKNYAPYNNMLVHFQNPSCSFYATAIDWARDFQRYPIEDARPMVIIAPMHPILLVYDVDQTEGKELPKELKKFAKFEGEWRESWLTQMISNANKYAINVQFKELTSTNGGFATLSRGTGDWKMRVVLHNNLDNPSKFGVLCHELAHIMLGHLGTDKDHWWPSRMNLDRNIVEIEAEAVSYIVTTRLGLKGSSPEYISRHFEDDNIPSGISVDLIAKISTKIESMAVDILPKPKTHK
jgi:hypothetical protein